MAKEVQDTHRMSKILSSYDKTPLKVVDWELVWATEKDKERLHHYYATNRTPLPADQKERVLAYFRDYAQQLDAAHRSWREADLKHSDASKRLAFELKAQELSTGCPAACAKCPRGSLNEHMCAKVNVLLSEPLREVALDYTCRQKVPFVAKQLGVTTRFGLVKPIAAS